MGCFGAEFYYVDVLDIFWMRLFHREGAKTQRNKCQQRFTIITRKFYHKQSSVINMFIVIPFGYKLAHIWQSITKGISKSITFYQ
jgi:hypothetical protein